ncbi:MAG: mannose-6-phosphate isomerase, class I [Candidatus Tenebribacter mawsonii]|nr:mannose-6-phosphate isomerase, class I [Candidatus Tenebribacter mawsonii]
MSNDSLIRIFKLRNPIRDYEWGSKTFIPNLMSEETVAEEPQAEMWMGTHHLASSRIKIDGKEESLLQIISVDPLIMLGEKVAAKFNNELPFLLKVLAAASPLSIQAHPNKIQAEKGFKLENKKHIPTDSALRTYKDSNHKPELICALTSFEALCGFQPIEEIIERFNYLGLEEHIPQIKESDSDSANLKKIFLNLMRENNDEQSKRISIIINKLAMAKARNEKEISIFKWISRLAAIYPSDMGVFSPLFLNLVKLKPGEAFFIESGVLHSYLNGCGVEIMANSDNVLRGGLTSKKVDIPQLTQTLDFSSNGLQKIEPEKVNNEATYKAVVTEFQLSKINVTNNQPYINDDFFSAEILLCTGGEGMISWSESSLEISSGESVFIPQAIAEYSIKGTLELFRAVVPV